MKIENGCVRNIGMEELVQIKDSYTSVFVWWNFVYILLDDYQNLYI